MIHDLQYFETRKNIIAKIASKFLHWNSIPSPDFVVTPHNKSFIEDPNFRRGYNQACQNIGKDYRIPWRVHQAIWAANHCKHISGDFVELGTGKGFIMQSVLASMSDWNMTGKSLWLYDIFQKGSDSGLGNAMYDEYYADNIEDVKKDFRVFENVNFVEGNILKSIKERCPDRISFLHVDLNNGDAEVEILDMIFAKISIGGIILLDDFANRGEEDAYMKHNSFFKKRGHTIMSTPSGQGLVVVH